jgi:hypothetical protein
MSELFAGLRSIKYIRPFHVFVFSLLIYIGNLRSFPEIDCVPAPYTAWSLVRHGDVFLGRYPELERYRGDLNGSFESHVYVVKSLGDDWVSKYPIGNSLACLPAVLPVAIFRSEPLSFGGMIRLGKYSSAVWCALAAAMLFSVFMKIVPSAAMPLTITFAFGSSVWSVASQASWGHGPSVFGISLAVWCLTSIGRGGSTVALALIAGVGVGFAASCRIVNGAALGSVLFVMLFSGLWRFIPIALLGFAVGISPHVMVNALLFNDAISGGYGGEAGRWTGNLAESIPGLLLSPSRGIIFFSPILALAFVGVVWATCSCRLNKVDRLVVVAMFAFAIVSLVVYGKWWYWTAGWTYGSRFLIDSLPGWLLPAALGWDAVARHRVRWLMWTSVAFSIGLQAPAVVSRAGYTYWHQRFDSGQVTVWNLWRSLPAEQIRYLGGRPNRSGN